MVPIDTLDFHHSSIEVQPIYMVIPVQIQESNIKINYAQQDIELITKATLA